MNMCARRIVAVNNLWHTWAAQWVRTARFRAIWWMGEKLIHAQYWAHARFLHINFGINVRVSLERDKISIQKYRTMRIAHKSLHALCVALTWKPHSNVYILTSIKKGNNMSITKICELRNIKRTNCRTRFTL